MGYNILIVDDSATTRAIIKRVIQVAQVAADRICEAANGKEALATLARERFDLVLADLNMPEMGGVEMTQHMQADAATRGIPVYVISAEPNAERLCQTPGSGIRGCLRKPFNPEAIRDLFSNMLGGVHA